MRVELDLPDWVDERNIHILAGVEEVAYRLKDGPWMVKVGRCNMCGKCCMQSEHLPFASVEGKCMYLVKEVGRNDRWLCGLGVSRPYNCCVSTPTDTECPIRYRQVS